MSQCSEISGEQHGLCKRYYTVACIIHMFGLVRTRNSPTLPNAPNFQLQTHPSY